MEFFERMRMAIAHSGLTQTQVAALAGLSQESLSHLTSEKKRAKGSTRVVALARVCGVSADWLADEVGEMVPTTYATADPKIVAALQIMEKLPEYGKDAAVRELADMAQLITQAKANGSNGTDG